MSRKFLCIFCSVLFSFFLCGCNFFTADTAELLLPPSLTGDMRPINEAIKKSVTSTYTLQYPSRGDYRSAVILQDINKDGTLEAFAFYSTDGKETSQMNINAVVNKDGEWVSVATQSINAGGVDRVEFSDLDRDGIEEILVGWEIYGTSELQLAVYSLGDVALTQKMLEQYTHFTPCDLDGDDNGEVFIVRSNPTESMNSAHIYTLTKDGVSQNYSCQLDSTAKTLNHPVFSTLSTGTPAIYIDEIKGVGAVTEVLFLEKGELVNPLLDKETKETTATLRSATLESRDINNDGILEIPVQREVPAITKQSQTDKQYLTDWCSFGGENLTVQMTALVNLSEGYYFSIPSKWLGQIAVLRDSENYYTEIYRYDPKKNSTGERLIYFKTVNKNDWDSGIFKNRDYSEIVNNGETSYLCNISPAAEADGIDLKRVKTDFKLF